MNTGSKFIFKGLPNDYVVDVQHVRGENGMYDAILTFTKRIELGKGNYDAYKLSVGGKTWNGDPMKEFHNLPENIQNAWTNGAVWTRNYLEQIRNSIVP